ncbi:MAG: hypothetical protein Kow0026_04230 [Oricola sp.]
MTLLALRAPAFAQVTIDDVIRLGAGAILQQSRPRTTGPADRSPNRQQRTDAPVFDRRHVAEVQQLLNRLGYPAGAVDGQMGPQTRRAIAAFQRDQGMPVTATVSEQLVARLHAAQAPSSAAAPQAQAQESAGFEILQDTDLPYGDYRSGLKDPALTSIPFEACRSMCAEDRRCRAFTYNANAAVCFLKAEAGRPVRFEGAVSGRRIPAAVLAAQNRARGGSEPAAALAGETAAIASRFGLRTLLGYPVITDQYAAGAGIVSDDDRAALDRLFELGRLALSPEAASPDSKPDLDADLCLANDYLSGPDKDRLLEPRDSGKLEYRPRGEPLRQWRGTGRNEFEAQRARREFADRYLPGLVAGAPRFPLDFVYVSGRVRLAPYDQDRLGFPIRGMPEKNEQLQLPRGRCLESYDAAGHLPIGIEFPTFFAVDPQRAETEILPLLAQSTDSVSNTRRIYLALTVSLVPAPHMRAEAGNNPVRALIPLKVEIRSIALYADPQLTRLVHEFPLDAPHPPVLETGVPADIPVPPRRRFDEMAVALSLLAASGDVLDRPAWERLARRQLQDDKIYYSREATRLVGGAWRDVKLDSYDPGYIPFAPPGMDPGSTRLTDRQLDVFRQWSLARAHRLPAQFVIAGTYREASDSGGFEPYFGIAAGNSREAGAVAAQGYVAGQLLRPNLGARGGNDAFDPGFATGGGKRRMPVLVFPNLVSEYAPRLSARELEDIYGRPGRRYPANLVVTIDRVETVPADGNSEAIAIHVRPANLQFVSPDDGSVIEDRPLAVDALGRGQVQAPGSAAAVLLPGDKLRFGAETADLLVARYLPDALDDAMLERMLLARWYYETSAGKRRQEPDWGRFFVKGAPKPDAAERKALLAGFREWTLRRAAAMPDVVTVRLSDAGASETGPIVNLTGSRNSLQDEAAIGACNSRAYNATSKDPVLGETFTNACTYLAQGLTIPSRNIYFGSVPNWLSAVGNGEMTRIYKGEAGVGPRVTCQPGDDYCYLMNREVLHNDLLAQPNNLNDVLVIDKEIAIPEDRPDLAEHTVSRAIEADVRIEGLRLSDRLPPDHYEEIKRRFNAFAEKAGFSFQVDVKPAEPLGQPIHVIEGTVLAARFVRDSGNRKGEPIADLELRAPEVADETLLALAPSSGPPPPLQQFGPDILGLRLGMSFDEADAIIRENMDVARVLEANRAWQTEAAVGKITMYTSGRRYENEDGSEKILLFDEPPAAKRIVLAVIREIPLPPGRFTASDAYALLRDKYGAPVDADEYRQLWAADGVSLDDYHCISHSNVRSDIDLWRLPDGSEFSIARKPTPDIMAEVNSEMPQRGDFESDKAFEEAVMEFTGTLQQRISDAQDREMRRQAAESARIANRAAAGLDLHESDAERTQKCRTALTGSFETGQAFDSLVLRLFDHRVYAEQFRASVRRLKAGERYANPNGKTAAEKPDVKL